MGQVTAWYHISYQKSQSLEGQSAFVCKGNRSDQIGWHSATLKTITMIILVNKIAGYWFGCILNLAYRLSVFLFNKRFGGENPSDCIWKHMCSIFGASNISCCCLSATLFRKPGVPLPAYTEARSYLLFQMVWPVLTFRNELNPGLHWTRSVWKLFPF